MDTIQLQREASRFTRRPSHGLDEPWDARLDFQHEQIKQSAAVDPPPCPFDEAQNGDYPRPSRIAKLSSSRGCSHSLDVGHQSSFKTSRAGARKHEEEKDRDSPRQPYRVKFIQGLISNSCKSIQQPRLPGNSYRGSNLKDSYFDTFEMPCDFPRSKLFAKLHVSSTIEGISSISDLHRETDLGETKQGSPAAEENPESESSEDSVYVEFKPRRKEHSKVVDKRMPIRQRVDDLRRRLKCVTHIVDEMENKLECGEGDIDYQTYKARPAAAAKQNLDKLPFAVRTKMPPTELAWSPVQEINKPVENEKEQSAAQLRKRTIDEYSIHQPPTSIASMTTSPKAGTFSIECLLGDQQGGMLDSTRQKNEKITPSRKLIPNSTPKELIRKESPRVSPSPMPTSPATTGYTLERKMGSGPVSSDQSPFGYLAIAFNDWEEWSDLACTGEEDKQVQEQSTQEAWWDEQKKSAILGKESSPSTPPGTPSSTCAISVTSTEAKQETNTFWTNDWGFPEENASLAEGVQSSSRCLRVPSYLNKFKRRMQALQCILLKSACQKHTDDEYIPGGVESLAGTDLEDDATLRGVEFCLDEE